MPKTIGRYEITAELGRGGMATVYRGFDPRFKRDVAIKVLPREFLHNHEFRSRFEREAETIAALEHAAIVPVYDFGEDEGQPFLVMRFMPGGSLADRLRRGLMTLPEAARILRRISTALDRAHSQGIVHRDLKPDNILFDADDEPYISDFGIVRILAQAEGSLTATGSIVGTPAYMSPEQIQGDKDIDGRSDVYSIGAMLFHMLSGELPYDADTPMGILVKHVTDPVPRIRDANPSLPPACDTLIQKAMAKNRDERFATAGEMARKLTTIAQTSTAVQPPAAMSSIASSRPLARPEPTRRPAPAPGAETAVTRLSTPRSSWVSKPGTIVALVCVVAATALAVTFGPRLFSPPAATPSPENPAAATQAQPGITQVGTTNGIPELPLSPPAPTPSPEGPATATQTQPDTTQVGTTNGMLDPLLTIKASTDKLRAVALSPDGGRLATGGEDRIIRVWDTTSGDEILSLEGHEDIVTSLEWSPDGAKLVSGSDDVTTRIWDASTGALVLSPLEGHTYAVLAVAWSPDGTRLASGGSREVIVWDAGSGAMVSSARRGDAFMGVAWSPDGTRLAASSFEHALILDPNSGEELARLTIEGGDSWDIAWSSDGRYLAAAGRDSNVHLWQADDWENKRLLQGHGDTVTSVVFSPDNGRLASAGYDSAARMWDVVAGTELSPALLLHAGSGVLDIDWSRDGRRLAAVSRDGDTWMWDATMYNAGATAPAE